MIGESVRIHDKFSIEIKLAYLPDQNKDVTDMAVNSWIFVPNSLDINRSTFEKKEFYRTIKSKIRLVTPSYTLQEIANPEQLPLRQLNQAFLDLAERPTRLVIAAYEYQIRMFVSIVRSALRDEVNAFAGIPDDIESTIAIESFASYLRTIMLHYREQRTILNAQATGRQLFDYYAFGDEFLSNLSELNAFRLMERLANEADKDSPGYLSLHALIDEEREYRKERGYAIPDKESLDGNRALVFRLGLLKKYAENELFLDVDKRKDGVWAEQIYLSLAAGLSMVFATAIAFSVQQKYGSFTMPLFVALVVSYMLKDRIKERIRYFLAYRKERSFFDHKTRISLGHVSIGWIKEAMDFVHGGNVSQDILRLRDRSAILEADNRSHSEKVILYRKLVRISRKALNSCSNYPVEGIHELIRFNITPFIPFMDDPDFPLYTTDDQGDVARIIGEKVYYLNLVLELKCQGTIRYQRYRIALNRKGIRGMEKL